MTIPVGAISRLLQIGIEAVEGKLPSPGAIARAVVGLGLDLVPVEELRGYLDEEARARAEAVFEALKDEKFGDDTP